jgi:quinol monooxygenase YgiN
MASASRSEDGCIEYRFSFDVDDPLLVRIYEEWASDADLAAHFTTDHFAAFGSVIAESVDGDITLTRHEVTSSGPLFA